MLIEINEGPPFDISAAVTIGGVRYNAGPTFRADLREDVLAFASGLSAGCPFTPEFGNEPLFNVSFERDQFVTYTYRPRFRRQWLWWLGNTKVLSQPEGVREATDYLKGLAASL